MKLQDLSFPFFFISNTLHHTHLFSLVCTGCLQVPSYYRCRIGCGNWSLTLATENMVLRNIFGHVREEVTDDWRENCIIGGFMFSTHQIWLAG